MRKDNFGRARHEIDPFCPSFSRHLYLHMSYVSKMLSFETDIRPDTYNLTRSCSPHNTIVNKNHSLPSELTIDCRKFSTNALLSNRLIREDKGPVHVSVLHDSGRVRNIKLSGENCG